VVNEERPDAQWTTRWDGEEGEHWVVEAERYDRMNAAFGDALLDAADLQRGERVMDIGCGNGATTLEAARRVGPSGTVVGLDASGPMLALAKTRSAHLDNVEFIQADAQSYDFSGGTLDVLVSRFGVMFFVDPYAAFANLARALRSGGRIVFIAWQGLARCEWILVPGAAAAAHVGMPEGIAPNAPGPFGLSDVDRTRAILEGAGFTGVTFEEVVRPMRVGDDVDDALKFIRSIPLVRDLLSAAPAEKRAAAIDAARAALAPYAGSSGVVMSENGAWLVSAER
jgi:SAM-dependent methyltransferase